MSRLLDDKQLETYKNFVPGHTAAEIANMVHENWGIQLTVQKVHALNIRNNIKSGLYQKYFGKADPRRSSSHHDLHKTMAIGTVKKNETRSKDRPNRAPIVVVKQSERKWKPNHRRIWEEAYGPIPQGYKTVFLDGNSLNFSITNLALVTDAEFLIMNEKHLISSDKQVTRSGIELARLLSKTHQIKRRKRKNERS